KEIEEIFNNTKTIAIIGLSPNEEKPSNKVAKYLQSVGFKIIPVYPKEEIILGEKVYRDLDDIEEKIDLVDVFRKADYIPTVVEKILKRDDVKTLWTQLGIVNNKAAETAKKAGLNVVQNHCTLIEHQRIVND
ncbi:MAG: CoA-binding protein, partial [Campylobacterales bacterium]|nr:CoA-binding protein [Campylobacterales bacterium]